MRLLLDTHIYLWCISNSPQLSKKTRALLLEATEIYISAASIWEISIKVALGKLEANVASLIDAITESHFLELPITAKHADAVSKLPDLHRDPFDRMLIAQAICEPLKFLTVDTKLQQYSHLVEIL